MRATVLLVRTALTASLVLLLPLLRPLVGMSAVAAIAAPMRAVVVRGFARASALGTVMGLCVSTG